MTDGPLIVQCDKTVLLEVDHELAGAARAAIAPFAELERAPEHVHTYRVTPLALWNARAAGHDAEQVVDALVSFSRYAVPQPLLVDIVDTMARYGRLQLVKSPVHGLMLVASTARYSKRCCGTRRSRPCWAPASTTTRWSCIPASAAASSRCCSRSAGPPRIWPATSTARRIRSACSRTTGICATIRRWRPTRSGRAARAWWCCRVARARRWSAPPRWPRPVPRR